jgi:hypothetical protein
MIALTAVSLLIHVHHDFSIKLDVLNDLLYEVYYSPLVRITPYIMGTLTAIYLHESGGFFKISAVISLLKDAIIIHQ